MAAFSIKTQLYALFSLRFYTKNAAKTWPMAAFFEENAAIDLRQSAVKLNVEIYGCVYKKNAAICPVLAAFLY